MIHTWWLLVQKEDLKVLVDQTQLQGLGKEFGLVRMVNQAKGMARDCAFLTSGKLCYTLQKHFSICVVFIWNKTMFFIANIMQLPMPSKLCWFQIQTSSCWPRSAQDFVGLLRLFFVISKLNCWWGMFILLQTIAEPWTLEGSWVMTDHVLFEWAFTSHNQVFSCKQFGEGFLDRWEMSVPHPLTQNSDSYQAFLNLFTDDWLCSVWMRWYKLQPWL